MFRRRIIEKHESLKVEMLPFVSFDIKIKVEEPEAIIVKEEYSAFECFAESFGLELKQEVESENATAIATKLTKFRR